MTYFIPQDLIFEFADRLLREANVGEVSEKDLESMIYEAGAGDWSESDDGFLYYIDYESQDLPVIDYDN
jgi:hypothetical protein